MEEYRALGPLKHHKGGRPWVENRRVLEGILRILRSGPRWQDLPEKHQRSTTCWRRLRDWEEQGVWLNIWSTFLNELNERQQLKFHCREKGAQESEKPSGAGDEADRGGQKRGWFLGRRPSLCVGGGSPVCNDGARGTYSNGSMFILAHRPVAETEHPGPSASS